MSSIPKTEAGAQGAAAGETPLKQVEPQAGANSPPSTTPGEVSPTLPVTTASGTPLKTEVSEESVRATLEKVIDPELHMNIIELGLVYKVEVINQGGPAPDVEVEMTLTSPGCPYGPVIMGQVPLKVKEDFGSNVGEVNVGLTFTPPWDPATMASEDVQFELGIF